MIHQSTGSGLLIKVKERPPQPETGTCEDCNKNNFRYIKKNRYLCRYCWDRDEYPQLITKTDEELDLLRQENLAKDNKKYEIINTSNLGFHA
jgi:hypothetical protein